MPKFTRNPVIPKPKDFKVEKYAQTVFQMYDEESRTVMLRCENSLMKSIIDKFGTKVKTEIADKEHFTAEVEISVSPTFFGWVVGFAGRVEIIAPEDVKNKYSDMLRELLR